MDKPALIYRRPYGKCRTLGTFIITPPHNAQCPTITSSQWQANHFLVTVDRPR